MIGKSGLPVPGPLGSSVTVLANDPSDADVTERLLLEFEALHGLRLVSSVIRTCRAELRNTASTSPQRSLETLVRSRLAALHSVSMGAGAA